jgi:CRISPR/Cas system-associated exonuclease Cas4 (RecB family)
MNTLYARKYNPDRSSDWNYGGSKWRLSRSKIDLFVECPRCFYLDNKLGTARPRGPAFTINVAVDELLKKEFDVHRKACSRHPIMEKYGIDALPFKHKQMSVWRDNFKGVEYFHEPTGLLVSGALDDVWQKPDGSLIVVDYKATSKEGTITELADTSWGEQYKRQVGVYQWLLKNNGFTIEPKAYFVYANASKDEDAFDDKLTFETTLVECDGEMGWIEPTLFKIKETLESESIPRSGERCEFCPYREASGKKLQEIHKKIHARV